MSSVALVLIICAGGVCHREQVPVTMTLIECAMLGQQVAAAWPLRPGERIRGWRCETGTPA